MNMHTGRRIRGLEHLRQSITRILTTPVGSRLERRPFGSLLPELIDAPVNEYLTIQLYAATATALLTYEPRLRLRQVQQHVDPDLPGRAVLDLHGEAQLDGSQKMVSLSIPLRSV
ncbi:baseplate assembly protein [Alcaligenaceae bacterium SJ-26]|nr:baseplate assembly protein [Alcaligenaceae bacterium SJ-26]